METTKSCSGLNDGWMMKTATGRCVNITTAEQYLAAAPSARLAPFDAQLLQRHHPDEHWVVVDAQLVTARCSLWWRDTPAHPQHQIGLIGHYASATDEAAADVLELACRQLAEAGCTLAVGPMDGSTWRDCRSPLTTETASALPFGEYCGHAMCSPASPWMRERGRPPDAGTTRTSARSPIDRSTASSPPEGFHAGCLRPPSICRIS